MIIPEPTKPELSEQLKPGSKDGGEIHSLTSLRGVLALWVVIFHFWNEILILFPSLQVFSTFASMGYTAVPAFFMLSGFVLAFNYADKFRHVGRADYFKFQSKRLARIYPVHLITLLTVAAMVGLSGRLGYQLKDAGYSWRDFLLNLLLIHTWVPDFQLNWNYPSWSISSEWFAYLLFPFVISVCSRLMTTNSRIVGFCGVSLVGACVLMNCWHGRPFYELLLVIPTFFAGIGAYWIFQKLPAMTCNANWFRYLPEILVLLIACSLIYKVQYLTITVLLLCYFGLITSLARLGNLSNPHWTFQPIIFLGEVSYSLYMTHTLAQKVLYRLLPTYKYEMSDTATKLTVLVAYVALVSLWCLVTYYLVERPCRVMLRSAKPRNAAALALSNIESAMVLPDKPGTVC